MHTHKTNSSDEETEIFMHTKSGNFRCHKYTGVQKSEERSLHKRIGYPIVECPENSDCLMSFFFNSSVKLVNTIKTYRNRGKNHCTVSKKEERDS